MSTIRSLAALALVAALSGCNESGVVPNQTVPTPTPAPSGTSTTPTPTPTPVSFVEENFHQGYSNSKVDVLWVIDDSGSMGDEQTELANSFANFISGFVSLDLDFHLGVVTTDTTNSSHSGKLQGSPPFLDQNTPNLNATFQSRVQVGTTGSATERGLEASRLALSPPLTNAGQVNYGFLRDDAVLSLLYVSDENDFSAGVWSDYAYFLAGLKADPSKVQVSAIVGPAGGCSFNGNTASDGEDYRLVASSFNGVIANICTDDFSSALQVIADAVAALATGYQLQHVPIPGTIQVFVDGVQVPGGQSTWSYNPTSNEIVFVSGAVPEECAVIQVRYALAPGQQVTEPVVNHPVDPNCGP